MSDDAKHKITVVQLFELAESLVADYDDPQLRQARVEFARLAAKERAGTLTTGWVRNAMIDVALAAVGDLYTRAEIDATPSPGDQTGATDG